MFKEYLTWGRAPAFSSSFLRFSPFSFPPLAFLYSQQQGLLALVVPAPVPYRSWPGWPGLPLHLPSLHRPNCVPARHEFHLPNQSARALFQLACFWAGDTTTTKGIVYLPRYTQTHRKKRRDWAVTLKSASSARSRHVSELPGRVSRHGRLRACAF